MEYILRLDKNFEEVEATHKTVCEEEPEEEAQPLCAVCTVVLLTGSASTEKIAARTMRWTFWTAAVINSRFSFIC
jgi:hypothetical protein